MNVPGMGVNDGTSTWAPVTSEGDQDEDPRSWLLPGVHHQPLRASGDETTDERFFPSSLSCFQINIIFLKIITI